MPTGPLTTGQVPGTPRLAYDATGRGDCVVFLHGIGGNRSNWTEQLACLASRFRAIAWDARGYGASDDYEGALDFGDFAGDLGRLLDHLEAPAAHLVGLSMGGRIALDFYERAPRRVKSLVLCDTFPGYDASFTAADREQFIRLRKQPLMEGREPRDMAPAVAKTLVGPNAAPAVIERLVASMAALHKASYIKAIEAMTRYEPVADLAAIAVPTLVVVGAQDRLTPPAVARAMAAAIAGARLVEIAEAGHLSNIEQPAAFNAALLDFLCEATRS